MSLTLTPMLCSRLLTVPAKREDEAAAPPKPGIFLRGYDAILTFCLRQRLLVVLVVSSPQRPPPAGWSQTAPKGFFPQEDIGQLQVSTEARQDISFDAMVELQAKVEKVFATLALCRACRLVRRFGRRSAARRIPGVSSSS